MPVSKQPNGPIPGENYTSDTKNYAWHRPPEVTNLDRGIERIAQQLSTKEGTYGLLNSLQMGISVVDAASMIVLSGMGKGLWTTDMALLLAGPTAHIIKIMAEDAGIKYDMGLDDDPIPTVSFYEGMKDIDQETVSGAQEAAIDALDDIKVDPAAMPSGGFAKPPIPGGAPMAPNAMPPQENQDSI